MYFVDFVISERFQGPLVKKSKYDRSDQMTMPGRRASKFSAKRRAIICLLIFQSLNSQAIPGFCECQPEKLDPQGLGEPAGGRWGNRWAALHEGIPY